jgi:hypothetical protein
VLLDSCWHLALRCHECWCVELHAHLAAVRGRRCCWPDQQLQLSTCPTSRGGTTHHMAAHASACRSGRTLRICKIFRSSNQQAQPLCASHLPQLHVIVATTAAHRSVMPCFGSSCSPFVHLCMLSCCQMPKRGVLSDASHRWLPLAGCCGLTQCQ